MRFNIASVFEIFTTQTTAKPFVVRVNSCLVIF